MDIEEFIQKFINFFRALRNYRIYKKVLELNFSDWNLKSMLTDHSERERETSEHVLPKL